MKLENVGVIKQITIPDNWQEKLENRGSTVGVRWERIFSPNVTPYVEVHFSYRGVPLDEASRKLFNQMLKQGEQESLSVEDILALHTVLGVASVGDNQHRNTNPPDSIEGPAFNLENAGIITINKKRSLKIDGQFKSGYVYSGLYYPAGAEGRVVEELFFQALGAEPFQKYLDSFQKIVDSIVWR